ncbi:MAG: hypothetical protein K0S23_2766 [Fluviicola sp.]|jgi:hypothetical protein|uniref:DUF4349 domain-containing protein n=1 Tax=Fluviicola sp. TaxID=1917219 RepID=UPI00261CCEFD|nr:DUF4349 domain-containing protein [Fluviicola sp.]MDF3028459.1 hypothetical protein [Fluviicola sp.]
MKKLITASLLTGTFLIPVCLLSCSYEQKEMENSSIENTSFEEKKSSLVSANSSDEEQKSVPKQRKKLIKTGTLSLKSKHIENSKRRLDQALRSLDGYYDNDHFSKSAYEHRYSLKIRVPAKNFEQLLQVINNGTDEIVSKDLQTEDVSGEYLDLQIRLNSKKAYLKRYEELLKKASSIEEMIRIEDQIRELIEEIESQEGRLTFLDDQVGYSTLDIELYKVIPHPQTANESSFSEDAGNAFSKGWTGIVTFALWLLSIWPLLLILIPAGIFGYRKLKKLNK